MSSFATVGVELLGSNYLQFDISFLSKSTKEAGVFFTFVMPHKESRLVHI